jgi:hypothetical protein
MSHRKTMRHYACKFKESGQRKETCTSLFTYRRERTADTLRQNDNTYRHDVAAVTISSSGQK